jgi:hypothetical protein
LLKVFKFIIHSNLNLLLWNYQRLLDHSLKLIDQVQGTNKLLLKIMTLVNHNPHLKIKEEHHLVVNRSKVPL